MQKKQTLYINRHLHCQGNGIKELFNEARKKYLETIGEKIIVNKENKVKKLNQVSKENDKRKNCC